MAPVITHRPTYSSSNEMLNNDKSLRFGDYIFKRLNSCGTKSIFGVPGDYNLNLLELMYPNGTANKTSEINWIGCCNELNAAYAADGYSRYTNKLGCIVTTCGVGELSAMNGISGSFAEHVKVLHIVGIPSTEKFKTGGNFHHLLPNFKESNLNKPNYKVFAEMVQGSVSCSTKFIENLDTACQEFDDLIRDIYKYSKPGYMFVPENYFKLYVNPKNLYETPSITLQDCITMSPDKMEMADGLTDFIFSYLYHAEKPAIIADTLTDRYSGSSLLNEFIQKTNIWNFSTLMGKSILDESTETYKGVYNGKDGCEKVQKAISTCDLILHFGVEKNEVNSGTYTFEDYYSKVSFIIEFHPQYIRMIDMQSKSTQLFGGVEFTYILKRMLKMVNPSNLHLNYPTSDESSTKTDQEAVANNQITQDHISTTMESYIKPGDVVLCDTGTFQFSLRDFKFSSQVKLVSQFFYLSIGYALPSALGVGIAMRDYPNSHIKDEQLKENTKPRLILFEGDGAAQMTVQELSTMLRYEVPMDIFLWNNDGYTIERAIQGPTRSYNDIQPWNWTYLFKAFGDAKENFAKNHKVETTKELDNILTELRSKDQNNINFVEVTLGIMDMPKILTDFMVRAVKHANKS
ncbi:hypothetical protein Kpol_1062p12 [Vanderwaltozyma polyspora DSM 70294]|uniref:Pyruvate decarboxylase n=1 Tax=Vanderwaltozyma polyspora (strain ATCC 22028 / DSM 70294 / BCRC 21397 / CBS 2163 / NBRC 10782 / NRRL Y-8283 / UCD 57-17) TaxID=436907 RepID=A7TK69_VANPO|nr:uncharacterized protein Kpol_1062p12 [Vanderwaltozyma polyspora DSM 70294]EDO17304.1 hypothetical protein Kpol_1062p12 [Vanderwaltozyma polyspora DSM 70294]